MIVYRCPACPHTDVNHDESVTHGSACSMGWCSCRNTRARVQEIGTRAESKTFPGFDQATGRWA